MTKDEIEIFDNRWRDLMIEISKCKTTSNGRRALKFVGQPFGEMLISRKRDTNKHFTRLVIYIEDREEINEWLSMYCVPVDCCEITKRELMDFIDGKTNIFNELVSVNDDLKPYEKQLFKYPYQSPQSIEILDSCQHLLKLRRMLNNQIKILKFIANYIGY